MYSVSRRYMAVSGQIQYSVYLPLEPFWSHQSCVKINPLLVRSRSFFSSCRRVRSIVFPSFYDAVNIPERMTSMLGRLMNGK